MRKFADENSSAKLKDISIDLIQSIHTVTRDAKELRIHANERPGKKAQVSQKSVEEAWQTVLGRFVRFVRATWAEEKTFADMGPQ